MNSVGIDALASRQKVISELEEDDEWRIELMKSLYSIENGYDTDVAHIVESTIDQDLSFATTGILKSYRILLPVAWIAILLCYFWMSNWSILAAIIVSVINTYITLKYGTRVGTLQTRLSRAGGMLDKYASALQLIGDRSWTAQIESIIPQADSVDFRSRIDSLARLKQISDLLDYRLHMIPSFFLNTGFLWDTHIASRLVDWKKSDQGRIEGIFEIIGVVEAIATLATWNANHPLFTQADIDTNYFHLHALNMRHPLLPSETCVPNDFEIAKGNHVQIITGSNMSGKSTFLRTVGLNLVLAYAGARVAVEKFQCGYIQLITYMRIKDALEENVSTFKAELNRIEQILQLLSDKEPVLILADEMLRGTNSADKLKGSKAVVEKIIDSGGYAIVATHDIGLTDLGSKYPDHVSNYFFDIDFEDGDLRFDYKIKPGICENFNASYLLSRLGIMIN